ncbi:MAG TPA: GGDEF domain-containing protein [Thermoanaerobaculia bacterium]|jgi:diguanylate cyclase (GGDEF)-like protein|nr:GGDEF domain-containing protein [Thermoanaerobaculia bacterium]
MLERLRNAIRPNPDEKPIVRKTTEVRLETEDPLDAVERAHQHEPALIMLEGDLPGQVFRLRPGRQVIGRRPECDIRVRERAVSGIHAEIIRVRDTVTINDLASTNGTLLNGLRIRTPVPLVQGNLLKLGNCVFRYVDSLLEVEFTEAMHTRGTTDQLTGAFNKSYLVARLGFAIDMATEARPVSVIAFDFDNFKQVNDQYGHAAGDHVLRACSAMIMESFVRPVDLFARMGGEEFVIVMQETTTERAAEVAEQLRRTLEERTFAYEGEEIRLTSSFGVCAATSAVEQPEFLLLRADELLYRSKREGRNRVSA